MTVSGAAIPRGSGSGSGQFVHLRAHAIEMVREMAGDTWTDYNYSDPGVTILEQVCYALTELPFRASLPVADLLSPPGPHRLPLRRFGLLPAPAALPRAALGADDLRRMVLDRVRGVANVWFEPVLSGADRGLYDVRVMPFGNADVRDDLLDRVLSCFHAHRPLGEDVRRTTLLRLIDARVFATLHLADDADPAEAMAEALYALGLRLAPEPRRQSLMQRLRESPAISDALSGPPMHRGFIPPEELAPFPTAVTVAEIRQILASSRGIASVSALRIEVGNDTRDPIERGTLPQGADEVLWIRGTTTDRRFTLLLERGGRAVEPTPSRVRRSLEALWREHRRTHALRSEFEAMMPTPTGRHRDLSGYDPVADQFPATYGVGTSGPPLGASPARRGQRKQLEGYLALFDQLLADAGAHVPSLPALLTAGGARRYPGKSLRGVLADADDLLGADYDAAHAALVGAGDAALRRKEAMVDLQLSLYSMSGWRTTDVGDDRTARLDARERLLGRVGRLTRDRGLGADVLRPRSAKNVSGLEAAVRMRLGMGDAEPARTLSRETESAGDRAWTAARDPAQFGRRLPDEWAEEIALALDEVPEIDETDDATPRSPLDGLTVPEALSTTLHRRERFRIGREASGDAHLVCVDPTNGWWWLGRYPSEEQARVALRRIVREATRRRRGDGGPARILVVEWPLLRAARMREDDDRFVLRVTVAVSRRSEGWTEDAWRERTASMIREMTPAHLALDLRYLDPHAMALLEHGVSRWWDADDDDAPNAVRELVRLLDPDGDPESGSASGARSPDPVDRTPGAEEPPDPETVAPTGPTALEGGTEPPVPRRPAPEPDLPAPTPDLPAPAPDPGPSPIEPVRPIERTPARPAWRPGWFIRLVALLRGLLAVLFALIGRAVVVAAEDDLGDACARGSERTPVRRGPSPSRVGSATLPNAAAHGDGVPMDPRQAAYVVEPADPGSAGVDCDRPLSADLAKAFAATERFVVRYVARDANGSGAARAGDLTPGEVATILASGLALLVVQHVAPAPWTPSGELGTSQADAAVANARAATIPGGATVFLDLEGVSSDAPHGGIVDFCTNWESRVRAAGYSTGLYVGADCGLDGETLGSLPFGFFWRSASEVPALPERGYAMTQTAAPSFTMHGVPFDRDLVSGDILRRTPLWVIAA